MICSNCESTEFVCGGCGVNVQPEPLLTASEVKVLTETARQETADRVAAEADRAAERYQETANHHRALSIEHRTTASHSERHFKTALAFKNKADGAWAVAQIARDLSSQAADAASDATSGVPGHPEVSEAVRSPQEPSEVFAAVLNSYHQSSSHGMWEQFIQELRDNGYAIRGCSPDQGFDITALNPGAWSVLDKLQRDTP